MKKIIVANWKMELTYHESIVWVRHYSKEFGAIAQEFNTKLIVCPSFTSLSSITSDLSITGIMVGAQDVSAFERGAYTGDVSVLSLKQLGCSYCVIGHSDRRINYCESNDLIGQKAALLVQHGITPIICIGEKQKSSLQVTYDFLTSQLVPVIQSINKMSGPQTIIIAYEPVWAIGTGIIPTRDDLNETATWLRTFMDSNFSGVTYILYGGSIDEQSLALLNNLVDINGYLVGKASTDPEALKKILCKSRLF